MAPSRTPAISNTDIVLVVLSDLGGTSRAVDVEDVAEAAWKAVPARFSWPRHQQYPDLDAVDVTLRAAKKNDHLVTGSKRTGWMLTTSGVGRVGECRDEVEEFIRRSGNAGRADNRRERGGSESVAARERDRILSSAAVQKASAGRFDDVSIYEFMDFFNINQYMPERKYEQNRQRILNLVRDDQALTEITDRLHVRFGSTYRTQLLEGGRHVRS